MSAIKGTVAGDLKTHDNQSPSSKQSFANFGSPKEKISIHSSKRQVCNTDSHCVRMTSLPICSAVVPGKVSYKDKPMACIGIFLFVDASLRNVRCGIMAMHEIKIPITLPCAHHNASGEESSARNYSFIKERSQIFGMVSLTLPLMLFSKTSGSDGAELYTPMAMIMLGLNSAIFSADALMRSWISLYVARICAGSIVATKMNGQLQVVFDCPIWVWALTFCYKIIAVLSSFPVSRFLQVHWLNV